jgi:phosphoribosylformylglycinamidine synthase I
MTNPEIRNPKSEIRNQRPVVAVLYGPGINCHEETAFAVELAGLEARVVNFHDVMEGKDALTKYQALVVPGGFSWGDHLGSGRIFGLHLIARAADQLRGLVDSGKPILGICNGFQILVETGLLPDGNVGKRGCALLQNKSAVLESRWVDLLVTDTDSIWTQGLEGRILRMPVAHGEGRLFWEKEDLIHPVVKYAKDGRPTEEYPACPSGSPGGIAGIRDSTGLIFGLMPHPERASLDWHGSTDGMAIFSNLARYLKG